MSIFYELIPLDTLFFRGSTPMEAGQNVAMSLFPPPVSVFEGAVRTAVLLQKEIDPKQYVQGKDTSVSSLIGNPNKKPPFEISSIIIKKSNRCYVQVPATWYLDSEKKPKSKLDYVGKKIISAKSFQNDFESLSVLSSEENIPFIKAQKGAQPLGNIWVSLDFLASKKNMFEENDFLLQSEIFSLEQQTGIALDDKKHTIKGQLYSSIHIRLHDGVFLVFSISKDAGLADCGKLFLGGERRICSYKKIDANPLEKFTFSSTQFVSLVPIEATEEILSSLVASSKIVITAGWDLAKGFHKPTTSWIPAGAVFNKNSKTICIPLMEKGE